MRRLINLSPNRAGALTLSVLPFVLVVAAYLFYSSARNAANPGDKLLPLPATIAATIHQYAFEEDERSGEVLLWKDTASSLERLLAALAVSAVVGLSLGLAIGVLPYLRATLAPFVAALSLIPPLAILPILFIVVGLGEAAKVTLIIIGVTPVIVRDLAFRTAELPGEQLIKAQTLGASSWQLILRVVLPQLWPRLIDAMRMSLGSAWLFLIAAEAIASTEGLGYRIFLVRRYLAMDVILPYVAWITLLAFTMDWLLRLLRAKAFGWAGLISDPGDRQTHVEEFRQPGGARKRQSAHRRSRVRDHRRCLGLRQDHVPENPAGHRDAEQGRVSHRWRPARRRAGPGPRHRIPALFAVSAFDRDAESAVGTGVPGFAPAWTPVRRAAAACARACARSARGDRFAGRRRQIPGTAVRRYAAAAVHRTVGDLRAEDIAAG
jgi:NitT/TauT family transport system permease protein